ncbi:MAG: protein kinase [Nitrososphaeraceae archaeon]
MSVFRERKRITGTTVSAPNIRDWPTPSDYMISVQKPEIFLKDPDLKTSTVVKDRNEVPSVVSGNFASVYRFKTKGGKNIALRCFLKPTTSQSVRYEQLSAYLKKNNLSFFVGFHYDKEGILVRGKFYPIVNMEWVEGSQLDKFIRDHLRNKKQLVELSDKFRKMMIQLKSAKIAHGDLQHGNVLITSNANIKLIDYDGVYIPSFATYESMERGHSNYQHPMRDNRYFHDNMDNFSSVLIYLSLIAIASDPSLFMRYNNPDNIIFTEKDLKNPANSELIRILRNSKDETIRRCVNHLISGINKKPSVFPDLETVLTTPIPTQTPVTLVTPQAPRVATPQAPRVATPQAPRKFDKKVKIIIPLAGAIAVLFLFYIFAVQPINQVAVPLPLPVSSQVTVLLRLPHSSQVTVPFPLSSQIQVPLPLPLSSQVLGPLPLSSQDIFTATSNKDDNLHLLTYNDPENGVSIMYPDNWKIYKTLLQFLKGYPIVTFAKDSDVRLMVTTGHIGNITSPATFLRKIMLPEIEKNDNFTLLKEPAISSQLPTMLGGKSAYALVYSSDNNINLQVGTLYTGKSYFIVYASTSSKFYENYETAKKIISSLKFTQ